jgi:hypothetical protein
MPSALRNITIIRSTCVNQKEDEHSLLQEGLLSFIDGEEIDCLVVIRKYKKIKTRVFYRETLINQNEKSKTS